MKVFLTGGTGFIGQHLVCELLGRGWQVKALARNPESWQGRYISKMGVQCVKGSITDCESLRTGMAGADIVMHLAGMYEVALSDEGRRRMVEANVTGVENVLSTAMELGIPRTVHVSTYLATGETGRQERDETFERQAPCKTLYEKTKTDGHAIARRYQQRGLPLIIASPSGVFGPNDHSFMSYFLRLYINHLLPPICWSDNCIYSLVDVDDLAHGLTLAAEKGRDGETYLFCGEGEPLRQQILYWHLRPGGAKKVLYLPSGLMALAFWPLEPLQRKLGLRAFMSREAIGFLTTNLYYSSKKAQQELGWTHMSAKQMWLKEIDGELELLAKRKKLDLVSRLNPVDLEVV